METPSSDRISSNSTSKSRKQQHQKLFLGLLSSNDVYHRISNLFYYFGAFHGSLFSLFSDYLRLAGYTHNRWVIGRMKGKRGRYL